LPGDVLTDVALNLPLTELDTAVAGTLAGTADFTGLKLARAAATLSSDTFTVTTPYMTVDTQGAAATDDMSGLITAADGDVLFLRAAVAGRTVIGKHNISNLFMANEADFALDSPYHVLPTIYDSTLGRYLEIGRPVGMEKIISFTQMVGSATSVVLTFPAVYRNLRLVGGFRTDRAAINDDLIIRYNADAAAANYGSTGAAFSTGAAYQEVLTTVATGNIVYFGAAGASAPGNSTGSIDLIIENALSTTLIRNSMYRGFVRGGTTTGQSVHIAGGGWWNNSSAAISSITILPRLGTNLVATSHYTLYGLM